MCFEVVRAYGFALMATIADPSASAFEFVTDQQTREYASELFVRGCVWRQTKAEYFADRKEKQRQHRERMYWWRSNQ